MFITFEGSEGAGKTTAIALVAARLRELGRSVLVTREPGSGVFGAQVREILLHGEAMAAESELFLFLADRANHDCLFLLSRISLIEPFKRMRVASN